MVKNVSPWLTLVASFLDTPHMNSRHFDVLFNNMLVIFFKYVYFHPSTFMKNK